MMAILNEVRVCSSLIYVAASTDWKMKINITTALEMIKANQTKFTHISCNFKNALLIIDIYLMLGMDPI